MKHGSIVVRSLPFALYIALLASGPLIEAILPEAVDVRWLYAIRIALVTAALALCWRHYGELRSGPFPGVAQWALGIGVGIAVFVMWINLDFAPLVIGRGEGFDPRDEGRIRWALAGTRLAGAALVVPVMEELFWRSFIMRWLEEPRFLDVDPGSVGAKALVISSVVFALEHDMWFAGLLAGLAYGWVYMRTKTLWVPVAAHAVTNGLLGAWVLWTGAWGLW